MICLLSWFEVDLSATEVQQWFVCYRGPRMIFPVPLAQDWFACYLGPRMICLLPWSYDDISVTVGQHWYFCNHGSIIIRYLGRRMIFMLPWSEKDLVLYNDMVVTRSKEDLFVTMAQEYFYYLGLSIYLGPRMMGSHSLYVMCWITAPTNLRVSRNILR